MDEQSNTPEPEKPLRFSMRTLLLLMTASGVLGALLAKTFEPRHQVQIWAMIVGFSILGIYLVHSTRNGRRRLQRIAAGGIPVRIDPKWLSRVRSPWFTLVAAFTGVSLSFAPFYLFWCGSSYQEHGPLEWVLVPSCFLLIYFVPDFYMSLAGEVLHQLIEQDRKQEQVTP